MENVGQANFFHHFRDLQNGNSWPGQIFQDLGLQHDQLFSTFSHEFLRKSLRIIIMVENVGQANFFNHFRDVKSFFRKSWSRGAPSHSSRNHGKYEN